MQLNPDKPAPDITFPLSYLNDFIISINISTKITLPSTVIKLPQVASAKNTISTVQR